MSEDLQSILEKLTSIKIGWDIPMNTVSITQIGQWLEETRQVSVKIYDLNYDLWNTVANMVTTADIMRRTKKSFDWSMTPRQYKNMPEVDLG